MAARALTAAEPLTSAPLSGCSPCVLGAVAAEGSSGATLSRALCTLAVYSAWHPSPGQPRFSFALVVPVDFAAAAWGCVDWLAVVEELRKVFSCLLKPEAKSMCSYCSP